MTQADRSSVWNRLAGVTRARIGLGRAGDALPTQHLLKFQQAHALARDAVMAQADFASMAAQLDPRPSILVHSAARDRLTYLRRPDLGRTLTPASISRLPSGPFQAVFVIGDGLSASAVQEHAIPLFLAVSARLPAWQIGPLVFASQARVALGDEIGAVMHSAMVVMLIGERPGLTVPNSLGVYLTFAPRPGRRDSERNCISNIHADGLSYPEAAAKLEWLMTQARLLQLTGVGLKEAAPATLPAP